MNTKKRRKKTLENGIIKTNGCKNLDVKTSGCVIEHIEIQEQYRN